VRAAVVGSALAVTPLRYLLRPGTAYASLCGPETDCGSGWSAMCCTINNGSNSCPPGSIAGGWWKADNSGFCGGGARYYIDCNATCSCGCRGSGMCGPGCHACQCHCASGTCDERRVCCNEFRYGQCHLEIGCMGPVVCRIVTCVPPWQFDGSCTTTSATANATALHDAPCLHGTTARVSAFGAAVSHGQPGRTRAPAVGIDATTTGNGYWVVTGAGQVFAFGDAKHFGDMTGRHLGSLIVDIAATPTNKGYWLVGLDGGIFGFGDAKFHGSMGGHHLNKPIVGLASTHTGHGYWMVASDGGIFGFGDAKFHGSMGGKPLNRPIVGLAATPTGGGYWMVATDGGIFGFGDAHFHGSTGNIKLVSPVTAMASTPSGNGYWLLAQDGGVFGFGNARFFGSLAGKGFGRSVDIAEHDHGLGFWVLSDS
jgi:hypothetical protein